MEVTLEVNQLILIASYFEEMKEAISIYNKKPIIPINQRKQ